MKPNHPRVKFVDILILLVILVAACDYWVRNNTNAPTTAAVPTSQSQR